ncbi:ATP-binding protein [Aestuariicoccus sp. MJ-SS9]|uniref:ATP-binding protein n=1 Tax=Aestuariicoccus sp. MJ-SS9 TaxID=3079855 RepID=UPI002908A305|nr:ATP-binding protein [Aestuariicoccus sp. MJ-SS9]MDU8913645.1 ATP-binding protein [Aestuariicoccus sp. MJ-SS9]
MWRALRENARTVRACLAVCFAAALALVLTWEQRTVAAAKERAVFTVTATSWKVSELIFETQRASASLIEFAAGEIDQDTLALRFDILWSRVGVVESTQVAELSELEGLMARYSRFLREEEAAFIGDVPLTPEKIAALRDELEALVTLTRRVWVHAYAGRGMNNRSIDAWIGDARAVDVYQKLSALLIGALMIYVLAEIHFAGRSSRRERRLREEAAQANATKTRFLANVSHEIRTPLNGILGMTSELANSDLDADQAACLRVIEQSGGVLLSTINDVLDLAKIEAGQFEIANGPFDLRALLEATCALYGPSAREKAIGLHVSIAPDVPAHLLGDGRRLRQVLHNLIANAVKFTESGEVRLEARRHPETGRLIITVTDTGPGIPEEAQERVFQPFSQADASITRKHGGTGLGLAISRQLCESMGGSLTLQGRPGGGATFICDLPCLAAVRTSDPQAAARKANNVPDFAELQVLVVDDNATNRLILKRFLGPTRAVVTLATSGAEAVRIARETAQDVILMDIQMPAMSGTEATALIRAEEARSGRGRSRIIAVTANGMTHQVAEYLAAGMDDVLVKPVSKKALFNLLGTVNAEAA